MRLHKVKHGWAHTYTNTARYEQRKVGMGNHAACKQQGSLSRQRKSGTLRQTGNHTFWKISVLETDKRKVGKDRNLLHLHITCCSLCFYYNKISLADEKYPSCTTTMTLLIKAIKDKIPSALRSRDENQERGPPNSFPNEYSILSFVCPSYQACQRKPGQLLTCLLLSA